MSLISSISAPSVNFGREVTYNTHLMPCPANAERCTFSHVDSLQGGSVQVSNIANAEIALRVRVSERIIELALHFIENVDPRRPRNNRCNAQTQNERLHLATFLQCTPVLVFARLLSPRAKDRDCPYITCAEAPPPYQFEQWRPSREKFFIFARISMRLISCQTIEEMFWR